MCHARKDKSVFVWETFNLICVYQMLLKEFSEEKQKHNKLQLQHQKLTLELADTKSQVHQGDYKIENYDIVKR